MLMSALRLSVLDQSPVSSGHTPAEALRNSVALAAHVESLGFQRFWISEHHAMPTLASSAPEILLAAVGAATSRIRLGSGGIMLPHYTALKVAEIFSTLQALYGPRIDLGIGRAPGGGPIESAALRRNRTVPQIDDFPDQLAELLAFLHHGFSASHPFSRIQVEPASAGTPDVWLLGSSLWSAQAAAEYGLPYTFAHFFSGDSTRQAIELYRAQFQPNKSLGDQTRRKPEAMAAVGVLCAESQKEADRLALSVRLLQQRIRINDRRPIATPEEAAAELPNFGPRQPDPGEFPRVFVGTPDKVCRDLTAMAQTLELEELVVNTITHSPEARQRSYTLLADAFQLNQPAI